MPATSAAALKRKRERLREWEKQHPAEVRQQKKRYHTLNKNKQARNELSRWRENNPEKHLVGAPRVAIQTALSNPQHYLQCECCQTDVGTVQDTLPDICIAYKLHLECGRLINLYDWLQAFTAVLEPPQAPRTSVSKGLTKEETENK